MLIIGCDFHPSGQQVYGIDTVTGEVFADQWLDHSGKAMDEFYASLPPGAEVGVESTGNLLWFERRLAKYGHRLRIGDAFKISREETRKQKHDRRDAERIARLLLEKRFPELRWVPTLGQRDQRQLLMHRHKLVRMRAQIKNQLQHIALNAGYQKKQQLWTKAGRELLEKLELEPWTARRRDELLKLLDTLEPYCASLDLAVDQAAAANADARLLMSHPGIGSVISLAFVLTIGDVNRFSRTRELISYLGLNPSEASSGERRRTGSISKQGSSFMRLLLIQGAQTATRDEELGRQYRRLAMRKNKAIAKVMVARKLVVRMFWMLKTKTQYPEVVRMRGSSSHPLVKAPSACVSTPPPQVVRKRTGA